MFGYLDLGFGTDTVAVTLGWGGGIAGMVILLIPGRVVGTALKS
jgi:hypothetical protein